jgi:putative transposase
MPKKTFTPKQIVAKLRQIEVLMSEGKTVPLACKEAGIVDQTFYRWRKEYGGLQLEQARKLKDLQKENAQLRRAVADLTVEKQILKDIAQGNFGVPSGAASPSNTLGTRDSVNGRRVGW